jgi:hypothetical protein
MCDLAGRGIVHVDRVPDAVHATKQALGHAHALIRSIEPTIGRPTAVRLSDAVSGVAGAYESEVTARLMAIIIAMIGGPGDVLVAPEEGGAKEGA